MVSKREVVPEDESPSESCLHCEINDVVQEYVEGQDNVDIAELAARMAESLVDLILLAPDEEQSKLLATAIAQLGHAFLEKSGAIGDSDTVIDASLSLPGMLRSPHWSSVTDMIQCIFSCNAQFGKLGKGTRRSIWEALNS
jgi:hypothetical protein